MTLDKYTLHKDQRSDRWRLEKEGSNRAKRTFDTKEHALKNLRNAVGPHGGSIRIRKVNNATPMAPLTQIIGHTRRDRSPHVSHQPPREHRLPASPTRLHPEPVNASLWEKTRSSVNREPF